MSRSVIDLVDIDLVPCYCGHLRDEHDSGFFAPCTMCGYCDDFAPDEQLATELAAQHGPSHDSARFTIEQVEDLIGEPATGWPGRCYEIAYRFHEAAAKAGQPLGGRVVYGHYRGFTHPGGFFGTRAGLDFIRHGWIDLGDGTVIDPTRWVFENVDPYLYEGPNDDGDYDEGGNVLLAQRVGTCPPFDDTQALTTLVLPSPAAGHVCALANGALTATEGTLALSMGQVFWLGNQPLAALGEHAPTIYQAMIDAGRSAMVPFDNRLKVLGS